MSDQISVMRMRVALEDKITALIHDFEMETDRAVTGIILHSVDGDCQRTYQPVERRATERVSVQVWDENWERELLEREQDLTRYEIVGEAEQIPF